MTIVKLDSDTCFAFLVRHGATTSNLANPPILQGHSVDGPLSLQGRLQADQAARCLSHQPIAAIFSSPLRRARETAERIAESHRCRVECIPAITEVNVGAWEGRSWVEIQETEPESYEKFQSDPSQNGYRDGENLRQVAERVVPAIEEVMQSHRGAAIAIVGHNVVNRVFLAHAVELPLAYARGLHQNNCGINILRYREGKTQVISINSILHLVEDL